MPQQLQQAAAIGLRDRDDQVGHVNTLVATNAFSKSLRKLEDAGYVTTNKNGSGVTARTSVTLTHGGRDALDNYTVVLQRLLNSARPS